MTTYLNLRIGASRRLAYLRGCVESHNAKAAKNGYGLTLDGWRDARHAGFDSDTGLSTGYNDEHGRKVDCWNTFSESDIPGRKWFFADEVHAQYHAVSVVKHNGWFADADCDSVMRGIVIYLSHDRYLAGYTWSENGEFVIFPEVYTEWRDAAHGADEHARICAEGQKEFSERDAEAREIERDIESLESRIEDMKARARECIKVRHVSEFWRDELRGALDYIREDRETVAEKRQTLKDDYSDVV